MEQSSSPPPSPTANRIEIKQLDTQTARRICSGQVISSMVGAVQQLIENAIDAQATAISIRFTDFGKDLFEVIDNGTGIESRNFSLLGKRNCTSKLNSFEEVCGTNTFGFRGEALNSLCNIANVSVCTRHVSESIGTNLRFDLNGNIISNELKPRDVGTTVAISRLFYSMPVRQKEFFSTYRRIYDKTLSLIYQYCVGIVGLKIICLHKQSQGFSTVFTSTGASVQSNIIEIFDYKQFGSLMPFVCHTDLEGSTAKSIEQLAITGFISKPDTGCGRNSTDRQYFYLNERPCDLAAASKQINQIYRSYNRNQWPFVLLKITIDERLIDRNLTPDKQKILLADNHYIFRVIQHSLHRMFARESADITSLSSTQPLLTKFLNTSSTKRSLAQSSLSESIVDTSKIFKRCPSPFDSSFLEDSSPQNVAPHCKENGSETEMVDNTKVKLNTAIKVEKVVAPVSKAAESSKIVRHPFLDSFNFKPKNNPIERPTIQPNIDQDCTENLEQIPPPNPINCSNEEEDIEMIFETNGEIEENVSEQFEQTSPSNPTNLSNEDELELIYQSNEEIVKDQSACIETLKTSEARQDDKDWHLQGNENDKAPDKNNITDRKQRTFECNIDDICSQYAMQAEQTRRYDPDGQNVNFNAHIKNEDNEEAIKELKHTLTKQSFNEMEVIGQFNLGFIVTKIKSNLFILDQHAIDERFNYETLLDNPKVDTQNLVRPLNLRISSTSELVIMDHMETFKKLGFGVMIDKDASIGQRLMLTKIPLSKGWTAGRSEVEEVVAAIRDSPTGDILEGRHFMFSDLKREIASRACRSSVMIGDALKPSQMKRLLTQLVDLRDPWHCAHNRPTIRHLIGLDRLELGL